MFGIAGAGETLLARDFQGGGGEKSDNYAAPRREDM